VITIEHVPVAEPLFRWSDDGVFLVGSRCAGCGTHYFPKCLSCRNPGCDEKSVEEVSFGSSGRLYSYTVQSYRPPPLFAMEPFEPYAIGLVELPEGLRVLGMLTGGELDDIRIGMPVELTVRTLRTDEAGREIVTYAYAPSSEEARS
jgi:uncharacterized OB-fold protein